MEREIQNLTEFKHKGKSHHGLMAALCADFITFARFFNLFVFRDVVSYRFKKTHFCWF